MPAISSEPHTVDTAHSTGLPDPVRCVAVIGPTATGKTRLGVRLASMFDAEIVSADSRQVYRGMDIGTGKDLAEYRIGQRHVPFHLIDVVEPTQTYHLFRFLADARAAVRDIVTRGKMPLLVGGTPLYIHALFNDYALDGGPPDPQRRRQLEGLSDTELLERLRKADPEVFARTDASQRRRIVRALEMTLTRGRRPAQESDMRLDMLFLAPYFPRHVVHRRIEQRLDQRLDAGMIEEVRQLHARGISWERLDFFGLEYRYVGRFIRNELSFEQMREQLLARIRRFCKAQDGWFRKMEREGAEIHWIKGGDSAVARGLIARFLAGDELPKPMLRLNDVVYGPRTSKPRPAARRRGIATEAFPGLSIR